MLHFIHRAAAVTALASALALFPGSVFAACPEFTVATGPAVGTHPYGIAQADFNVDGKPDLALANFTTNNVSILMGQGDGTFAAAQNYQAGLNPIAIAAGDLDGDGRADLVTANFGNGTFSVLRNDGNGTFGVPTSFQAGASPWAIALAKVNPDNVLDVVVAEYTGTSTPPNSGNTISVSLGDGLGAFGERNPYNVGYGPSGLALGDLNGDGLTDLAVSHANSTDVAVLLNTGHLFGTATMISVGGAGSEGIAMADLDRNGDLDLAVGKGVTSQLAVLMGHGTGGFAAPVNYAVGAGGRGVAAEDFNGDGVDDVAVGNFGAAFVSLLVGNGNGTLQAARSINHGAAAAGIATGDFNRDGRLDIATANKEIHNTSILLGSASCAPSCTTFAAHTSDFGPGTAASPVALATADFDHNGWMDVAIGSSTSNEVRIHLRSAIGIAIFYVNVGRPQNDLAVGDFNNDRNPDLVTINYAAHTATVQYGDGSGNFYGKADITTGLNYPSDVATGDFNRDGYDDIAFVNEQGTNEVAVYVGGAYLGIPMLFGPTHYDAGTAPVAIAARDLTFDGWIDLVIANRGSNDLSVLRGSSAFGFVGPEQRAGASGSEPADVAIGDVDGDGRDDVISTNKAGTSISIYRNRGVGGDLLDAPVEVAAGGAPVSVTVGDYNMDGRLDVAAAVPSTNKVAVFPGNFTTTPGAAQLVTIGGSPLALASLDIERNGRMDVAVAGPADTLWTVENPCATSTTLTTSLSNARFGMDVVTLTVNVTSLAGTVNGVAQIRDGSVTGTVITTVTVANGIGSYATSSLAIGNYTLFATFATSTDFTPSSSAGISQSIRIGEPENLTAAPVIQPARIDLTWTAVPGATSYRVYRVNADFSRTLIASPPGNSHSDSGVSMDTTYLYQVSAMGGDVEGSVGPWAAATIVQFTDDPLVAFSTVVSAIHITELRAAVNVFRARAGLQPYAFDETTPVVVKAIHLQQLRSALSAAYNALGFTVPAWTDLTITQRVTPVKAVHFNQLRSAVRSASGGLPSPG